MRKITGEVFSLSDDRIMLRYNEQEFKISAGEHIVLDDKIYLISGVVAPNKENCKWSVQIEKFLPGDPYYNAKICRCFSSPTKNFVKGDFYRWTWCIDGMIVYDDHDKQWSVDEIGFYRHFVFVNGK